MDAATSYKALQKQIETVLEDVVRSLGVTEASWPNGPFSFFVQAPKAAGFDACFSCYAFGKELGIKAPKEVSTKVYEELVKRNLPIFSKIENGAGFLHYNIATPILAAAAFGEYMVPRDDKKEKSGPILIEFSSPNTNKPQHLGHVRNNCLGASVSLLLDHQGYDVTKIVLVNDRGIHICKSMLAYKKFGEGKKPSDGPEPMKPDHFVGKWYVEFEIHFKAEYDAWLETDEAKVEFEKWKNSTGGKTVLSKNAKERPKAEKAAEAEKDPELKKKLLAAIPTDVKSFKEEYKNYFMNNFSALGKEANDMLKEWEDGNEEVRALWQMMNDWVFEGFKTTYERFGVSFNKWEKESQVYDFGRKIVLEQFEKGKLEKLDNGSIACDLINIGVLKANSGEERKKVLLRANGTTVYMTQDVGTAINRWKEHNFEKLIYVVASEQDRHFQVLFKLLENMEPETKSKYHHLSYGMVNLPSGRMKSREGTVVDADNLLDEIKEEAVKITRDKWPELVESEAQFRAEKIALAAIKYYILAFTPASTVKFDPEASLSFSGKAGPYLLYQYARTRSILGKAGLAASDIKFDPAPLVKLSTDEEIALLRKLYFLPRELAFAAQTYDPSKVADAVYELTRTFNQFYRQKDKHQVVNCQDPVLKAARLQLVVATGDAIKRALNLLGIETLERM